MNKSFLLLLLFFPAFLIAQESKRHLLEANNPIIGEWELIRDSAEEVGPPLMFEDDDCGILIFKAGNVQSIGASFIDTTENMIYGSSYFVAKTDGKKIYGVCEVCVAIMATGNKIEFDYRYDKSKDQLIIIKNGRKYIYKRNY